MDDFESFTGVALSAEEEGRVTVLMDRARRRLSDAVTFPESLTADQEADWDDAVSELTWYYWEAEKAGAMEIIALPVLQLSLGTLFWTKPGAGSAGGAGGPGSSGLGSVKAILDQWGSGATSRARITLEGGADVPRLGRRHVPGVHAAEPGDDLPPFPGRRRRRRQPPVRPSDHAGRPPVSVSREETTERRYSRDGLSVQGVVAFKYHDGDEVAHTDSVLVYGPGCPPDGRRYDIAFAKLQLGTRQPSHWEVVIGEAFADASGQARHPPAGE